MFRHGSHPQEIFFCVINTQMFQIWKNDKSETLSVLTILGKGYTIHIPEIYEVG